MKHLKPLLLLLLFFAGATAFAQSALVVDLRDGSSATFLLDEKPRVTFAGRQINIVSLYASMEFERSDVKNWHFTDNYTSIDVVDLDAKFTVDGKTLVINGVKDGTAITLYNVSGVVVRQSTAIAGICTIPFDDLPVGLYIVTYNNTTFKFLKK